VLTSALLTGKWTFEINERSLTMMVMMMMMMMMMKTKKKVV